MRRLYRWHIWIGLFVSAHFAVLSVTGLLLLFRNTWQTETPYSLPTPAAYAQAAQAAFRLHPTERPLALFPDEQNPERLKLRLGQDGATQLRGSRRLTIHVPTQQPVAEEESGFFTFLLTLHRELFLKSAGKLYVGFIGLLYIVLLCSGLYLYGPFTKGRRFGQLRTGRQRRWADLHKYMGIATFAWGLLVGVTGACLAFNSALLQLFQTRNLKALELRYPTPSHQLAPLQTVLESAHQAEPQSHLSYLAFPGSQFGMPGHYLALLNGTGTFTRKLSQLLVIDAQTGQLTERVELPLYLKAVQLSEPLHFGDFGGWPLRILWGIFALGSCAVALLGPGSWLLKRRRLAA